MQFLKTIYYIRIPACSFINTTPKETVKNIEAIVRSLKVTVKNLIIDGFWFVLFFFVIGISQMF